MGQLGLAQSLEPARSCWPGGFVVDRTFTTRSGRTPVDSRRSNRPGPLPPTASPRRRRPVPGPDLARHVTTNSPTRGGAVLPRLWDARSCTRSAKAAADDEGHDASGAARRDDAPRPGALPGAAPSSTHSDYRRPRRLRDGAVLLDGSFYRPAGPRHPRAARLSAPQTLHCLPRGQRPRVRRPRRAYVDDPAFVDVPLDDLLSDDFATERDCTIDPAPQAGEPVRGRRRVVDTTASARRGGATRTRDQRRRNVRTTNLTVADRWGNVVRGRRDDRADGRLRDRRAGRGFLLNNRLTDFTAVCDKGRPQPISRSKRPRSSMSPTILLRHGKPFLAVGRRAARRSSPRCCRSSSTASTSASLQAVRRTPGHAAATPRGPRRARVRQAVRCRAQALGHDVVTYDDVFTGTHEIGAATGIPSSARAGC